MIEKELIEKCKKGDLGSFTKVVDQVSPFVFSVAFRLTGDEETARDIVQETMVTVWQKINRINTPESFKTWLYRITTNKCYDLLRKRKRSPELRIGENEWRLLSQLISEEEDSMIENEEAAIIIKILTDRLSSMQKSVFVLSELEGMSADEISKVTGILKTRVKANLYYARKKIGMMLKNILQYDKNRGTI